MPPGKRELAPETTAEMLTQQETFWETKTATVDGMLDGYGALDPPDTQSSTRFINSIFPEDEPRGGLTVLDVGAGIGRVTKHVLIPAGFGTVDLLDNSQRFLDYSTKYVDSKALGERYCAPMHSFDFGEGKRWSLIWVQWCAIYLPDVDFTKFFKRAAAALDGSPRCCIVLKENILSKEDGKPEIDAADASATRSDLHLKRLWKDAGLKVVAQELADGFPDGIYPVKMYALKPEIDTVLQ
eukprot:m.454807 g.454807  ORF g.454807 m.454807 type:complete len:240 (-) comp20744_c0_seq1:65-784(-)